MSLSAYREALSASERALAILASSEDTNPAVRARLLLTIGSAHLSLTDHAIAAARFEGCIASLARSMTVGLNPKRWRGWVVLGWSRANSIRLKEIYGTVSPSRTN